MGADSAGPQLAWWLVPSASTHGQFQSVISSLAERLGGPVFEPHLTLALSWLPGEADAVRDGGLVLDGADLPALARTLAARLRPVVVSPDGLGHSPAYFRAIFLCMAAQSADRVLLAGQVDVLGEELARVVPGRTTAPAFDPHLSLFYGEPPASQREHVVTGLAAGHGAAAGVCGLWQSPVRFDTLVAVRPRRGASGFDRVADWDVFLRVKLAGQG